jgi:hypothetical protein
MRTEQQLRDGLTDLGYVEIAEHHGIRPGVRVRQQSHRYPDAYRHGTGTVLAVYRRDPSSWSQTHDRPDVELIVAVDHTPLSHDRALAQLADYHVALLDTTVET